VSYETYPYGGHWQIKSKQIKSGKLEAEPGAIDAMKNNKGHAMPCPEFSSTQGSLVSLINCKDYKHLTLPNNPTPSPADAPSPPSPPIKIDLICRTPLWRPNRQPSLGFVLLRTIIQEEG